MKNTHISFFLFDIFMLQSTNFVASDYDLWPTYDWLILV